MTQGAPCMAGCLEAPPLPQKLQRKVRLHCLLTACLISSGLSASCSPLTYHLLCLTEGPTDLV